MEGVLLPNLFVRLHGAAGRTGDAERGSKSPTAITMLEEGFWFSKLDHDDHLPTRNVSSSQLGRPGILSVPDQVPISTRPQRPANCAYRIASSSRSFPVLSDRQWNAGVAPDQARQQSCAHAGSVPGVAPGCCLRERHGRICRDVTKVRSPPWYAVSQAPLTDETQPPVRAAPPNFVPQSAWLLAALPQRSPPCRRCRSAAAL